MTLKRIGVLSAAKIAGILYAIMGLFAGGVFSLAAMAGAIGQGEGDAAIIGVLFGVGAIVILPVLYGVIGAIFAAIGAAIYNVLAGTIGGLELEIS